MAQCNSGIVGSFPSLNARSPEILDEWLSQINKNLNSQRASNFGKKIGPFAVNLILHSSNKRLSIDFSLCVRHRVPIYITSLSAPPIEMIDEIHSYGGIVLHDVINIRHASKAIEAGVDGLILVAAGAGGHAGSLSPFAICGEVRQIFDGPIILSGAISTGSSVLAAQAMGADFAYVGTRFIASQESAVSEKYKEAIVEAKSSDIVYTDYFTGVYGNYLSQSIINAGIDLDGFRMASKATIQDLNLDIDSTVKPWKDIWGAGQGVGLINDVPTVNQIIERMKLEYVAAKKSL